MSRAYLWYPRRIKEIQNICKEWGIIVIEDAAESLGSYADGEYTGTIGSLGVYKGSMVIQLLLEVGAW